MSASIIKKRSLAGALKELMRKKSFSRVSVTEICELCGASRKSFYYHFKDKEDLVNWIFNYECADELSERDMEDFWLFYRELAEYLYANQVYYANLARVSETHHFDSILYQFLFEALEKNLYDYFSTNEQYDGDNKQMDSLDFISVSFMTSLKNWIMKYPNMTVDEFIEITRFEKLLKEL